MKIVTERNETLDILRAGLLRSFDTRIEHWFYLETKARLLLAGALADLDEYEGMHFTIFPDGESPGWLEDLEDGTWKYHPQSWSYARLDHDILIPKEWLLPMFYRVFSLAGVVPRSVSGGLLEVPFGTGPIFKVYVDFGVSEESPDWLYPHTYTVTN